MATLQTAGAAMKTTVKPVMRDEKIENFMLKINGRSFRCSCGANVFHKPDDKRLELYECNGCESRYEAQ